MVTLKRKLVCPDCSFHCENTRFMEQHRDLHQYRWQYDVNGNVLRCTAGCSPALPTRGVEITQVLTYDDGSRADVTDVETVCPLCEATTIAAQTRRCDRCPDGTAEGTSIYCSMCLEAIYDL